MSKSGHMRALKIPFLCAGNSCRSQMAKDWARHLPSDVVEAYSTGVQTHGLNPHAVRVVAKAGMEISGQRSKHLDESRQAAFDHVITVCGQAHESCPVFPAATRVTHVPLDEPPCLAREAGTEEEASGHYRRVRVEIQDSVATLADSWPSGPEGTK